MPNVIDHNDSFFRKIFFRKIKIWDNGDFRMFTINVDQVKRSASYGRVIRQEKNILFQTIKFQIIKKDFFDGILTRKWIDS